MRVEEIIIQLYGKYLVHPQDRVGLTGRKIQVERNSESARKVSYATKVDDHVEAERKDCEAASRFFKLCGSILSTLPNCGVETPESSRLVASVRDPALLGGTLDFFPTSAATVPVSC